MDLEKLKMTEDKAVSLKNSSDWQNVCNELDYRISSYEKELRYVSSENLIVVQQKIQALEELKTLPQDVIDRESAK